MDLSNLSSDLPPTKPVNQASINDLSKDLTTEFKNAAKSVATLYNSSMSGNVSASVQKAEFANAARSVAALYRLSNNATSLLQHKGYLNCLDDMLHLIAHGADVENWVLTKRAEIINMNGEPTSPEKPSSAPSSTSASSPPPQEEDFKVPQDFKFTFNHDIQPDFPFVASFPPLSVSHPIEKRRKESKREVVTKKSVEPIHSDDDAEDTKKKRKIKAVNEPTDLVSKKKWKKGAP